MSDDSDFDGDGYYGGVPCYPSLGKYRMIKMAMLLSLMSYKGVHTEKSESEAYCAIFTSAKECVLSHTEETIQEGGSPDIDAIGQYKQEIIRKIQESLSWIITEEGIHAISRGADPVIEAGILNLSNADRISWFALVVGLGVLSFVSSALPKDVRTVYLAALAAAAYYLATPLTGVFGLLALGNLLIEKKEEPPDYMTQTRTNALCGSSLFTMIGLILMGYLAYIKATDLLPSVVVAILIVQVASATRTVGHHSIGGQQSMATVVAVVFGLLVCGVSATHTTTYRFWKSYSSCSLVDETEVDLCRVGARSQISFELNSRGEVLLVPPETLIRRIKKLNAKLARRFMEDELSETDKDEQEARNPVSGITKQHYGMAAIITTFIEETTWNVNTGHSLSTYSENFAERLSWVLDFVTGETLGALVFLTLIEARVLTVADRCTSRAQRGVRGAVHTAEPPRLIPVPIFVILADGHRNTILCVVIGSGRIMWAVHVCSPIVVLARGVLAWGGFSAMSMLALRLMQKRYMDLLSVNSRVIQDRFGSDSVWSRIATWPLWASIALKAVAMVLNPSWWKIIEGSAMIAICCTAVLGKTSATSRLLTEVEGRRRRGFLVWVLTAAAATVATGDVLLLVTFASGSVLKESHCW